MFDFIVRKAAAAEIAEHFGPAKSFPTVSDLVNVLLRNALVLAGIIAFVATVYSGIKFIQSAGDAKATEQNKGAFTASVIGLIIIFGAYFIVTNIGIIVGIPLLN